MTIHRTRLFYSTAGAIGFHAWLDTWLTNMTPWEAPEVDNEIPTSTVTPIDGGEEHYRVELAFAWTEDRAHILDNLDQYLQSYCDWHRIAYHECSHDQEDGGPCSWSALREAGTVPSHVPEITIPS